MSYLTKILLYIKDILSSILGDAIIKFTAKKPPKGKVKQVGNDEDLREEIDDSIIDSINDRIDDGV